MFIHIVFASIFILVQADQTPEWSTAYSVKGVLYIPYAEISEPFAGWYDASVGSSRIDYYGGMVQTYQLSGKGQFGISLKVAPMTTEKELNAIKCFQVNGTQDGKIKPQSALPDLSGFQLVGKEIVNDFMADKWQKIQKIEMKVNEYTMYLRWKKSPKTPKIQSPIPIRYEMKGYNSLLGSHYDHYYLNYEEFTWDNPSPDIFDVSNGVNSVCTNWDANRTGGFLDLSQPAEIFPSGLYSPGGAKRITTLITGLS